MRCRCDDCRSKDRSIRARYENVQFWYTMLTRARVHMHRVDVNGGGECEPGIVTVHSC